MAEAQQTSGDTVTCPYCASPVSAKRLKSHQQKRCPKSPQGKARIRARVRREKAGSTLQVRVRLARLFKEIELGAADPDDIELAKLFVTFYRLHVDKSDDSLTLTMVSGGLPSLGKGSR